MNRNRTTRRIVICSLIAAGVFLVAGRDANADYIFGTPTNLGSTVNSSAIDAMPNISPDGLALLFNSTRPGGYGWFDIWMTTRPTISDPWGTPVNLGDTLNSSSGEGCPSISADGLELYFSSDRPAGYGSEDIYVTTRTTKDEAWSAPVNLGPNVNHSSNDWSPSVSADGLVLYFGSDRPGGSGWDIWATRRATREDDWSAPVNLGPTVNSPSLDATPSISADGLVLLFQSNRPGGYGGPADIWLTSRATIDADWGSPINLGAAVNSSHLDGNPTISADGSVLFFTSDRPGGYGAPDIWQVSISPDVDLNRDGKVDILDMGVLLLLGWGTDNSRYDIGPMPWGDGIVDSKDLMVLVEHGAILAGDVNFDGVVDFLDLAEVMKNWLQQQP